MYLVTTSTKSKGIAVLLVFLFGGFGLFYSSIIGGVVMGILAPLLVILSFFAGITTGSNLVIASVIIFCCSYYIICFVWAIRSVGIYNRRILSEANAYNKNYTNSVDNVATQMSDKNDLDQNIRELYQDLDRLTVLRETKVISEEQYDKQKQNILQLIEKAGRSNSVYEQSQIRYEQKSNKSFWWLVIIFLLLLSLVYYLYDSRIKSRELDKITSASSPNPKNIVEEKKKSVASIPLTGNKKKEKEKETWVFKMLTAEDENKNIEELSDTYLYMDDKDVYLLSNNVPIKKWEILKVEMDDEDEVYLLNNGDSFSLFGDDIWFTEKANNKNIHYTVEGVSTAAIKIK